MEKSTEITRSIEIDGKWYELPNYQPERLTLSQALNVFAENIPDIKEACQLNILGVLQRNPKAERSGNEDLDWVRDGVRELSIKQGVEHYQKTLRRIASIEAHKRNPYRATITDAMIERAREYPIADLYDGQLRGPESGRRFGCCPFHNERTGSFCIHPDNRWSCFGQCGEHGDSISFYQKMNGVSFKEAVKFLSGN